MSALKNPLSLKNKIWGCHLGFLIYAFHDFFPLLILELTQLIRNTAYLIFLKTKIMCGIISGSNMQVPISQK
jgi:hypothetical protein